MKKNTIYIIEDMGLRVQKYELLLEDDFCVYVRYQGEKGRGSSRPKYFAHKDKTEAYNRAAQMLEERAKEHRDAILE